MNIKDFHPINQLFSESTMVFEGDLGITSSLQILKGIQVKQQVIQVSAMLICIKGKVIFQNEKGKNETLVSGDFVVIKPMLKYSLRSLSDSILIVIK